MIYAAFQGGPNSFLGPNSEEITSRFPFRVYSNFTTLADADVVTVRTLDSDKAVGLEQVTIIADEKEVGDGDRIRLQRKNGDYVISGGFNQFSIRLLTREVATNLLRNYQAQVAAKAKPQIREGTLPTCVPKYFLGVVVGQTCN